MEERSRGRAKRVFGFAVFLAVVALVVCAVTQRQLISDQFAAMTFEPSARVVELVDELNLTDAGERTLLATRPTVDASQHFNDQCAGVDHSEQGHVLGCYTGDRIHLFGVTDPRVSGIVEVTAAHELLHAVYARLAEGDRMALAQRLRTEYDALAEHDDALRERMSIYEHLSDTAFANELHSVLGTEVRELPEWLEEHYATWFADRGALVDRFDAYHSVFVGLQREADALEEEMETLRADVENRKAEYDHEVTEYNADAEELEAAVPASTAEQALLDRRRSTMTQRRADLDATRDALQIDIDRYNDLREQLTELSAISSELDRQLNSELAPVTTRPAG
ncbi:hypothetical protein MUN78_07175 [Leucobacter allii]|uniref:Uncharacterized protein n=1 Tax=Leucobacter allii TaxID=2932247 RepID=A0ABY4FQN5_9MICO|nr:hypothetical protein [Leucobacter allii]UOQ58598.1 hypothetical protein MUN78_07175 [Leucobacter allii]UOR03122.1 hypothetical protein MUN77_07495 [Leucobacter allii]